MHLNPRVILACSGALALLSSTNAADLFWGPAGAGGAGTWDNGITANWFNGTGAVPWSADNTAVFGGSAGTVTVSGPISGVGGLTFNTDGYLVSGSRLNLSGAPVITVGSGLFATNSSILLGNTGLTIGGGGTLFINGAITNTAVTVNAGTTIVANNALATQHMTNLTLNGTLDLRTSGNNFNAAPVLSGAGLVTNLSSSTTYNLRIAGNNDPIGDFAGSIGGKIAVVYQGSSTQILSGANTHSGFLLLRNSGNLRLAHPGALTPNSYLEFQGGSYNTVELAAGDLVRSQGAVAGGVNFNGGNNYFAAIGADRSVSITNAAAVATWGTVPFNLSLLGFGSPNSTHKITWTEPFDLGAPSSATDRIVDVLDGPAAVDAEITGNISGDSSIARLDKRGAGTLVLSGINSYNGETRVEAGTLALANDSAAGYGTIRFHLSGATLRSTDATTRTLANNLVFATDPILGSAGTGDLIINGAVDTGGGGKIITINNATTTFNNDLAGASANPNTKAGPGTLVLNAFTSATKPMQIAQGTLALGPSGGMSSTNIVVGTNTLFDVSAVSGGYILNFGQTLRGEGVVKGNATAASGAVVSPGLGIGTLTFNNNLALADTTALFELTNNVTEGAGINDLLQVNGNLDLSGLSTISVVPLAGNLANGTYKLIKYNGTLSGGLGNLALAGLGGGTTRQVASLQTSTPHEIDLVVSGTPASLLWQGNDALNPTWWDLVTTTNWLRGGTPDAFFNFDNVTFEDSAISHNVELTTALSPTSVAVDTGDTYLFYGAGNLTGIASLTKDGLGTLILGNWGVNDNNGTTTINTGTLQVGNSDGSGSLGTGAIVNNSVLKFQTLNPITVPNAISGTGALIHEGQTDLVLNGTSSFTGPVLVNTNALLVLKSSATPASTSASLGNSTNVTVLSDGALHLSLNGTFNSPLYLNGDGWAADVGGALETSGTITWNGPVTLNSDASIGVDGGSLTLGNSVYGNFALTKVGSASLVLGGSNYYGSTILAAGTLQVGDGGTNGTLGQSSSPIVNDGILRIQRSDTFTITNEITGTGEVHKYGSGTLVLTTSNSFSGRIMTAEGTLALGADGATGTGVLRLGNGQGTTIRSSTMATRTINNSIDFATSAMFGSADSGDLVFNGDVNSGSAGKTLTINNAVTTFNGPIAGGPSSNPNTKAGPGTLIFNGTNTYSKPTIVNEGTLLVNGGIADQAITVNGGTLGGTGYIMGPVTVQPAGTLAPGTTQIGTLTISNTLTLLGNTAMEINKGTGARDMIGGLSSVTYGGTLTVNNLGGTLAAGDTFQLFSADVYSGAFSALVPTTPGGGLAWDTSTLATDGTLRITTGTAAYPTNLTAAIVGGNTLKISWPDTHLGWILQGQTNAPGAGLSANWVDIAGSESTNQVYLTLDPANGSAFYRLTSP